MNRLRREDIAQLAAAEAAPSISIYMPVASEPDQRDQNRIRLKNLIAAAREQLVAEHDLRPTEAQSLLQPAQRLIANGRFWAEQGAGVAIFLTATAQLTYHLPLAFNERVMVCDRFYLKPLLPLLARNGRFYVLALSLGQVQLLEGTQYGVREVPLDDKVPTSLDDALQWDDPEQRLQWHTSTARGADRPAAFHGHGVTSDETKNENILRYFQKIDANLKPLLQAEEIPVVLAAINYLLPLYREANSYGLLLDGAIKLDPQSLSTQELHERAWNEILEPYFAHNQSIAATSFRELSDTERVSTDLAAVVRAAHYGQIDVLFAARDEERWGTFDEETNRVATHDEAKLGDDELVDLAAVQTLINGGTVYVVNREDVPQQQVVAAIFRYPAPN